MHNGASEKLFSACNVNSVLVCYYKQRLLEITKSLVSNAIFYICILPVYQYDISWRHKSIM